MPSCEIQVALTSAITPPWNRAAGPPPGSEAARSPAREIHCATATASGTAVPATAIQRATAASRRPNSQASSAATAGIAM